MPQKSFYVLCRAIATPDPNYFWRMSLEETPLTEVGILRDNGEAMLGSVVPDRGIVCVSKPNLTDVNRARETIYEIPA